MGRMKEDPDKPYYCYIGVHTSSRDVGAYNTYVFTGIRVGGSVYETSIALFDPATRQPDTKALKQAARFVKDVLRREKLFYREGKIATKFFTDVNVSGDERDFFRFRLGIKDVQTQDGLTIPIGYGYELEGGFRNIVDMWEDSAWEEDGNGPSRSCLGYDNPNYVDTFDNEITF
jgi:hypothetical protein